MDKLTDEKISSMCPQCREAARDWIVDVNGSVQRIIKASKRIEIMAFVAGAGTMLAVFAVIAACSR